MTGIPEGTGCRRCFLFETVKSLRRNKMFVIWSCLGVRLTHMPCSFLLWKGVLRIDSAGDIIHYDIVSVASHVPARFAGSD